MQLAQFRYRLATSNPDSLPFAWWRAGYIHRQTFPPQALENRMEVAVRHIDKGRIPIPYVQMPPQVTQSKAENREKSYQRFLQAQCSNLWRTRLENHYLSGPGRVSTYVKLFLDSSRKNLFRPAPYLSDRSNSHQLELLRLRIQGWIDFIPTHLHYGKRVPRLAYINRWCPHCQPNQVLGDESHYLLSCPAASAILERWTQEFNKVSRLLDVPLFSTLQPIDKVRVSLGNPPPTLLQRQIKQWQEYAPPVCSSFVRDLRLHINQLQSSLHPTLSSDDESAYSSDDPPPPLQPPPSFQFAQCPSDLSIFEPLNPAGQLLVGRKILYKWPRQGWCLGEITQWNHDPTIKNKKQIVNFFAHYACDNTHPRHVLTPEAYNQHADSDTPNHTWILLESLPTPQSRSPTPPLPAASNLDDDYYEADSILDHRGKGRNTEYLIRWTNYGPEHDSWEPKRNCTEALIREYHDRR